MNILELANYNLKEQAQFKDSLNPTIWNKHEHLKNAVKEQILVGAEEYCAYLGLTESQVKDIVVAGDNAGYNYTVKSDIDVVIVADLNPDPTFREFFNENKYRYNGQQQVKVGDHLVKFYVQPADEQFVTRGSYSVIRESWNQVAVRRLTESQDTVKMLKQADMAAQSKPAKKVAKKKVIKEHKPTVYGFGREEIMEVELTPDGTNPTTCQFTNEEAPQSTEETLLDFVHFCSSELGLENEPILKIRKDPEWSKRNKTFGRFNGGTGQLEVSIAGRHVMDILRTIAHELTHQHQHEREDVPDHAGDTGSEWENEANARAGILMRDYGQEHPHLFAEFDELSESFKFKPCQLSSIELSTVLQKSYAGLSEQSGNRWYPHRCSHLARYVVKSQQNLISETADLKDLFKFQKALKNIDGRSQVTMKAGKSVAIIQVIPHTADAIIELNGFKTPKKIKDVFTEDNGNIKYVEFIDGSTYPDQHFISAGKGGGELEGTNTLFFLDKQSADHAVTMIGTQAPNGWNLSTVNINEGASGYIPTKKQAKDPRYSMALTTDIKPGTLGKVANAFMLNTDSQGKPQEANPNGTVKRLKEELEFMKLTEAAKADIDNLTVDQMLDYANRMHTAGFKNDVMIKKHPRWKLTTLPLGVLQLKDPGRKDIDNAHVQTITELDLETRPIIVGSRGVIIDGNHRARRAFELGIDSLPAFVPKL